MGKIIDLTGQTFNRLYVIGISDKKSKSGRRTLWNCKCECGSDKIIVVVSCDLKNGNTQSCGCIFKENLIARSKTHGLSKSKLYHKYYDVLQRCYNPNNTEYHNYGGRGITMCDEWRNDFIVFYKWAMANGYNDGLTIERINVESGSYEPSNVIFIPMNLQGRNKRLHPSNKTGTSGVIYSQTKNRYVVSIGVDGRKLHIGNYTTLPEAVSARKQAEITYWGRTAIP